MTDYRIIPRSEWGARHEDGFGSAPIPAEEVWLHHSVTLAPDLVPPFTDDDDAVRTLERIGEQRFGRGISYTWAITPSGRIYQGHGVARQGSHTKGRNSAARAIVLVGDYSKRPPTEQQVNAAAWLLRHAKGRGWIRHARLNGGHRDSQRPGYTECPGDAAEATITEINRRALISAQAATPTPSGGFMSLSDAEQQELLDLSRANARVLSPLAQRVADIERRQLAINVQEQGRDAADATRDAEDASRDAELAEQLVQARADLDELLARTAPTDPQPEA